MTTSDMRGESTSGPDTSGTPVSTAATRPEADQIDALLHRVGIATLQETGWIRVTGTDRVRWLNGMVTNSITELKPGEGNYSFALNAQGRIQGDLWTYAEENSLLIKTALNRVPAMMDMFERFIIMDDVELEDISAKRHGIEIAGPRAEETLQDNWISKPRPGTRVLTDWRDWPIEAIAAHSPLVSRFELWVELEGPEGTTNLQRMRDIITETSENLHGRSVDAPALEALRILEGTPRFGVDIRDRELPQETGQARALHFSKGCYLGQEIVERIRSRGNVHRAFTGFHLEGELPPVGSPLLSDGKPVGELTSIAAIPLREATLQVGLGYIRREALERHSPLSYASAGQAGTARPISLPMRTDGSGLTVTSITQI